MKYRPLLSLVVLVLASLACQVSLPDFNPDPQPGGVLFQDDFSDPSSGWARLSSQVGETDYNDGVYRIWVNQANTDVWARPSLQFQDVRVEVDATKIDGPDDNDFGVLCRAVDDNHFYFFVVSSDGYYGIGKVKAENRTLLGLDALQPSEEIRQGGTTNHLRADCVGDRLTLYANDKKLYETHDAEYKSGDVGLIAGSYETPGTDIHFDNFSVLKP